MAEIDQIVSRPAAGLNILDDRSLLRLIWLLSGTPARGWTSGDSAAAKLGLGLAATSTPPMR
jgi:hypothetical protein